MLFARAITEALHVNPQELTWELADRFDKDRVALMVVSPANDPPDTFTERPEPPRRRGVSEPWLPRVYRASVEDRHIDAAIDFVLETLDDLLFARDEEHLRKALADLDVERVSTEVILAFLMGTFRARGALGESRENLYQRAEEKLRREEPEDADALLRGLR